MSRLLTTSDLHLGHKNICKYRTKFTSAEEHHNFIFENLALTVGKRDTLYILGDCAFDKYWLEKVKNIKCQHKKLICGNHDTEHHTMRELCEAFDSVEALMSKRNVWFSHCPIHPQEMRGRLFNIHGHCVDMQTQILTTTGWKFYDQINVGDEILSVDPNDHTKVIKDKILSKFKKKYTGNMVVAENKSKSMRITDEHRVPFINHSGKFCVALAKDIVDKSSMTTICSGNSFNKGLDLSDNLLELYIAIAADGNITPSKLVRFILNKERKVKYVRSLLEQCGIPFNTGINKSGTWTHFRLPQELNGYNIKGLDFKLLECNKHQAEIIRKAYRNTDGNRDAIFTSKPQEKDILSLVFIQNGYGVGINERFHGFGKKLSYTINLREGNSLQTFGRFKNYCKIENVVDEDVWCVETGTSFWFAKRKYSIYLTGNCHNKIVEKPVFEYGNCVGMEPDIHYFNACVEHTNYKPINFSEIMEMRGLT